MELSFIALDTCSAMLQTVEARMILPFIIVLSLFVAALASWAEEFKTRRLMQRFLAEKALLGKFAEWREQERKRRI